MSSDPLACFFARVRRHYGPGPVPEPCSALGPAGCGPGSRAVHAASPVGRPGKSRTPDRDQDAGKVMVKLSMVVVAPAVMAVLDMLSWAPLVEMDPSKRALVALAPVVRSLA